MSRKILLAEQIRELDRYTIEHEPIGSLQLMERAASACIGPMLDWCEEVWHLKHPRFVIFCGNGNNGGDGLVAGRILWKAGYSVMLVVASSPENGSADRDTNLQLAIECGVPLHRFGNKDLPDPLLYDVVIDAIFGTGLNRPAEGIHAEMIQTINRLNKRVISLDVPSGLSSDAAFEPDEKNTVRADLTLTLEVLKPALVLPGYGNFAGVFKTIPIGLHSEKLKELVTPYHLSDESDMASLVNERKGFDHKGKFGHLLLLGGSSGKYGAAILGAKAALRSGCGLLTVSAPTVVCHALAGCLPEAMTHENGETHCTEFPYKINASAVAAGPGWGAEKETRNVLKLLLQECKVPVVLDADAINILAEEKTWQAFLPPGWILTPHPGEFDRLAGKSSNSFERLQKARDLAARLNCVIVLKGAFTAVVSANKEVHFNPTGNAGMAKGGSGDTLTGIIGSLLAQGYGSTEAARLGVYLHGLSADIALKEQSTESLLASDVSNCLGEAFEQIKSARHD